MKYIILLSLLILSSCRPANEMRGQPGDIFKCEYIRVWGMCPGSIAACCLFKTPWGATFKHTMIPPTPTQKNVALLLNYRELEAALEYNRCSCGL